MTIYLIRHANAGRRQPGGHDRDRPLDESGLVQAARIHGHLDGTDIAQVLSSPARRCVETVRPLADGLGLTVDVDEALREGRGATAAMTLLARLAAADRTAVLCSHGDVIPMALDTLASRGVTLDGAGCAKGSIWRLETAGGEITGAAYTAAP